MTTANQNRPVPPKPPVPRQAKKTKSKSTAPARKPKYRRRKGASRKVRKELSAGGVVVRKDKDDYLVALLKTEHKRGEVWVLPKGHVELHKGERISEAAKREVEEEAGVRDLSVKDQLGVTRFTFQAEDAVVKKTVHYFLMLTQQKTLTPQEEEGLIDAAWYQIDEAIQQLEYDTDQDIVSRAQVKLTGKTSWKKPAPQKRRSPRLHT